MCGWGGGGVKNPIGIGLCPCLLPIVLVVANQPYSTSLDVRVFWCIIPEFLWLLWLNPVDNQQVKGSG